MANKCYWVCNKWTVAVCVCVSTGTCQPIRLISWVRGLHGITEYLFTSCANTVVSQSSSSPGGGGGAEGGFAHFMRRKKETYGKRTGEESVYVVPVRVGVWKGECETSRMFSIGARGCKKKVFCVNRCWKCDKQSRIERAHVKARKSGVCARCRLCLCGCAEETHRVAAFAVWWNFSHLSAFGLLPFFINSINRWAAAISEASRWFSSHTRAPHPLSLLSIPLSLPRSNTTPPPHVWGAIRPLSPKSQGEMHCTYMHTQTVRHKESIMPK